MKIGVIGVQGAVSEHIDATGRTLKELGIAGEVVWLRSAEPAKTCDAFIIPGGESTTITDLMKQTGLWEIVKNSKKPVLGVCAGLIIISKIGMGDTEKTGQELMGLLNCKVNRNAFGRQRESFEAKVSFNGSKLAGVFIRAPAVEEVYGDCKVVAEIEGAAGRRGGGAATSESAPRKSDVGRRIVGVEEGNSIGIAFHPELTEDLSIHKYFINKIR